MTSQPVRVVVGYDGSPSANVAIDAASRLLPGARCWVVHLWTPPFASESIRQRLWSGAANLDEFNAAIEREGAHEAEQIAATGVILARAAGWDAEPLVRRSFGGEGLLFGPIAEEVDADLVVVGARGLRGTRAALGSVSDMVVHHTPRPVLVVPRPILTAEYAALEAGPVLVGYDGSAGAQGAGAAARRLFPARPVVLVTVDSDETEPPDSLAADVELVNIYTERHFGSLARPVADALAAYAREREAAVLVVGSRGRSTAREILLGSVTRAVLHRAHRPVIVVPSAP